MYDEILVGLVGAFLGELAAAAGVDFLDHQCPRLGVDKRQVDAFVPVADAGPVEDRSADAVADRNPVDPVRESDGGRSVVGSLTPEQVAVADVLGGYFDSCPPEGGISFRIHGRHLQGVQGSVGSAHLHAALQEGQHHEYADGSLHGSHSFILQVSP